MIKEKIHGKGKKNKINKVKSKKKKSPSKKTLGYENPYPEMG